MPGCVCPTHLHGDHGPAPWLPVPAAPPRALPAAACSSHNYCSALRPHQRLTLGVDKVDDRAALHDVDLLDAGDGVDAQPLERRLQALVVGAGGLVDGALLPAGERAAGRQGGGEVLGRGEQQRLQSLESLRLPPRQQGAPPQRCVCSTAGGTRCLLILYEMSMISSTTKALLKLLCCTGSRERGRQIARPPGPWLPS
jgi:hypothetical protein